MSQFSSMTPHEKYGDVSCFSTALYYWVHGRHRLIMAPDGILSLPWNSRTAKNMTTNVTGTSLGIAMSSKWVKFFKFWMNYPLHAIHQWFCFEPQSQHVPVSVLTSSSFPRITSPGLPASLYSIPHPPFIALSQPKLQRVTSVSSSFFFLFFSFTPLFHSSYLSSRSLTYLSGAGPICARSDLISACTETLDAPRYAISLRQARATAASYLCLWK